MYDSELKKIEGAYPLYRAILSNYDNINKNNYNYIFNEYKKYNELLLLYIQLINKINQIYYYSKAIQEYYILSKYKDKYKVNPTFIIEIDDIDEIFNTVNETYEKETSHLKRSHSIYLNYLSDIYSTTDIDYTINEAKIKNMYNLNKSVLNEFIKYLSEKYADGCEYFDEKTFLRFISINNSKCFDKYYDTYGTFKKQFKEILSSIEMYKNFFNLYKNNNEFLIFNYEQYTNLKNNHYIADIATYYIKFNNNQYGLPVTDFFKNEYYVLKNNYDECIKNKYEKYKKYLMKKKRAIISINAQNAQNEQNKLYLEQQEQEELELEQKKFHEKEKLEQEELEKIERKNIIDNENKNANTLLKFLSESESLFFNINYDDIAKEELIEDNNIHNININYDNLNSNLLFKVYEYNTPFYTKEINEDISRKILDKIAMINKVNLYNIIRYIQLSQTYFIKLLSNYINFYIERKYLNIIISEISNLEYDTTNTDKLTEDTAKINEDTKINPITTKITAGTDKSTEDTKINPITEKINDITTKLTNNNNNVANFKENIFNENKIEYYCTVYIELDDELRDYKSNNIQDFINFKSNDTINIINDIKNKIITIHKDENDDKNSDDTIDYLTIIRSELANVDLHIKIYNFYKFKYVMNNIKDYLTFINLLNDENFLNSQHMPVVTGSSKSHILLNNYQYELLENNKYNILQQKYFNHIYTISNHNYFIGGSKYLINEIKTDYDLGVLRAIIGKHPIDAIKYLSKKYKIIGEYNIIKKRIRTRLLKLHIREKSDIYSLLENIDSKILLKIISDNKIPKKLLTLNTHNNPRCKCNLCSPIRDSQLTKFIQIAKPILINNAIYYKNVTIIYKKLLLILQSNK